MPRSAVQEAASGKFEAREYSFTVVFEPVSEPRSTAHGRSASRNVHRFKAPATSGYQSHRAPFAGINHLRRTLAEAREMARETPSAATSKAYAKMASAIPDEKSARKRKNASGVVCVDVSPSASP